MVGVCGYLGKIAHEQRWVDMKSFKQGSKGASDYKPFFICMEACCDDYRIATLSYVGTCSPVGTGR
jgi:hypothetical protein